jgi:hypothetical protein
LDNPDHYARVHRRIKRLWEDGEVVITAHAQRRMAKRRIDLTDVQTIIVAGSIISHERREGTWRYRIQGATVAGRTASCVVAVEGRAIIVSVLDY